MKNVSDMMMVPVSDLIPYVNNARTHSPEQVMKIRSSLREFGFINPVIIDADKDIDSRRSDILKWKQDNGLEFELFLLPNDKDAGALEDLLENIINPNNKPIFECWEGYEKELVKLDISGRTPPPLTTPAKKTKIYGYLEAYHGETKREKELIKEANRNYADPRLWNLDAEYLGALKGFLEKSLMEE